MGKMIDEALPEQIIGGAIEVHRHWGLGLYEEIFDTNKAGNGERRTFNVERRTPTSGGKRETDQ